MKASEWKTAALSGQLDEKLLELYQDPSWIEDQRERYAALADRFVSLYGDKEVVVVSAAGRTEVSGNHTDHQHGRVLAASVNLDTIAMCAPTDDNTATMVSDAYVIEPVDLAQLSPVEAEKETSAALIRGMASVFEEKGFKTGGFEAVATSSVLAGAGLSSSASFETLIGMIFSALYNDGAVDLVEVAKAGQKAENVFFGKPCGLLDQCACAIGGLITIDFKDNANPVVRAVDTDFSKFGQALCIVDTKGSHADLTDEYAAVPGEMKAVAKHLGKDVLREVDKADFIAAVPALREQFGDRAVLRALHFFNENERVPEIVAALENGDLAGFRKGIEESGKSSWQLNQNISVSGQPQNQELAVALALSEDFLKDHGFCRVHGGGFAGTIQAFVDEDTVPAYKALMESVFGEDACHVLKIRPMGGTIV